MKSQKKNNVVQLDEARIRAKLAMVEDKHQRWLEGRNPSPLAEAMDDYKKAQEEAEQKRWIQNQRVIAAYRIKQG